MLHQSVEEKFEPNVWYVRDAVFYRKPNTRGVKKSHLPHPTAKSQFGHTMSLCRRVPLIGDEEHGRAPLGKSKCKRCLAIQRTLDTESSASE